MAFVFDGNECRLEHNITGDHVKVNVVGSMPYLNQLDYKRLKRIAQIKASFGQAGSDDEKDQAQAAVQVAAPPAAPQEEARAEEVAPPPPEHVENVARRKARESRQNISA